MAVNIVRYEQEGVCDWGVLQGSDIHPLKERYLSTGELICNFSLNAWRQQVGDAISFDEITLLSPVTHNQQFICQGVNYRQHKMESGMDPDQNRFNMFFRKASSCMCAADADVLIPDFVSLLDYEIELGLVIGETIDSPRTISQQDLPRYIAGLVIVNDYSARDIQIPQMQFYKGKSYRTFGPVGPFLALLEQDDYRYLNDLHLKLTVNGEERQSGVTANMIYPPAATLTELSGLQDLAPGDLVSTGTPEGCALSIPAPMIQRLAALLPEALKWQMFLKRQHASSNYLKQGDLVEASISSSDGVLDLGVQRNRIVC